MKSNNFSIILLPGTIIMGSVISTADKLSGKFFGPSIPFLEDFYANDFLIWIVFLAFSIGYFIGNIKLNFIKDKRWEYVLIFAFLILMGNLIHNYAFNLPRAVSDDYDTLRRLLDFFSEALVFSGMVWPLSKFIDILQLRASNPI